MFLDETTRLPPTITSVEYAHRDSTRFLHVCRALRACHDIDYVSLSHIDFRDRELLEEFLRTCVMLQRLKYLVRFVDTTSVLKWIC